jgi:Na+(H+)/acetate symporter ActP
MSGGPMPLTRFLKDLQGFGERKHVWVEANLFAVFGHAESEFSPKNYEYSSESNSDRVIRFSGGGGSRRDVLARFEADLKAVGISALALDKKILVVVPTTGADAYAELARIQLADSLKPVSDFARKPLPEKAPADSTWLSPFGPLTTKAAKAAKLSAEESKPYSLLYTYSLIIALVCGTAGLPHILVRFYTNPDGVAAKRTTMWVMILIGVFYLFPPVFGVMGRNLLPDLYAGVGAKGTDKIVLELPRILNEKGSATVPVALSGVAPDSPRAEEISARTPKPAGETPSLPSKRKIPWGSILSGITCAGAFAAFMSTFSGLLVSMTGAMAHDVYGRMLRPKATPEQRLRAFKIAAVGIGAVAILLGMQVEPLQINFMVGQAFAIAAASYFPLLFMSCWWRGMTMKGAALGMLAGGVCALAAVTLTNFSDLGWFKLADFWAAHPLLRILCEQPAIWTVPLAIGLMVVVSKLTVKEVPADIRMKMLVLHAPEKLGLKQEYIQEHAQGH